MNSSTISSVVTPLLRAIRSWPRSGSRVPTVAAMVTDISALARVSRPGLDQESPNVLGCEATKVIADGRFPFSDWQVEAFAQQLGGLLEGAVGRNIGIVHRFPVS